MNGLIVAAKPYTDFPSGGMAYCVHASHILDAPIWSLSSNTIESVGTLSVRDRLFPEYTTIPAVDYFLIGVGQATKFGAGGFEAFRKRNSNTPIIVMMHDIWYLQENGEYLDADGFIVSMDETADVIRKYKPSSKVIRLPLSYVIQSYEFSLTYKDDKIISTGRIVPEKGHRHVAQLAGLNYKVLIAGQKVYHEEFRHYYDKIASMGAEMYPNPKPEELVELLKQSKVFMGFTYTAEQHCQPEYSLLEAVNFGCLPVVASWMKKYTDETGLIFGTAECAADAIPFINKVFSDNKFYVDSVKHNLEVLKNWSNNYRAKLEEFIKSL